AGREVGGDVAIMMVEANGTEGSWDRYEAGAPKVTEEAIADGLEVAKRFISASIDLQRQLVDQAGARPPIAFEPAVDYSPEVYERVKAVGTDRIAEASSIADKASRSAATDEATEYIKEQLAADVAEGGPLAGKGSEVKAAVRSLVKEVVRRRIVTEGLRIDGRGPADLRPVSAEVGVIPTAHGSGLFQRGETQVLNVTTLGMPRMDQLLDTIGIDDRKRYMHHYNMPPYANGETGRVGSPKRREIGHGLLAERALLPVVPAQDEFPYALRLVSEVLASNGSTSMASVCASSLSLMDAGVPIKAPVAGIAMGLVYAEGKYLALTDILGAEDAMGDMDFKVAGTADAVTALQLDTKIDGLPAEVLAEALTQARDARLKILDVMREAIAEPRPDVGETAPKIVGFEIPMDKIGEVIGPKGKVINAIQAETGADISVDDDGAVGTVAIGSVDRGAVAEAERQIKLILDPPTADVGAVYMGRVVNITKFGAFVNILPGRDGLVHISKLGGGKRIDRVEDVVSLGDEIEVRVDDVDPNGKVSLTPADQPVEERAPRGGGDRDRGDRDRGDRGGRDRDRGDRGDRDRGDRGDRGGRDRSEPAAASSAPAADEVSFEASFDAEVAAEFGDLGPAGDDRRSAAERVGGGDDGPRRRRRRR
ncbi:MAG TPA: polyribonucleotide nucleotidyltransferase, partial [Acidimicrobiales bacterium]|nr:polyribonucleotide nucleotidyltransferase [Acidimicrobiales bacterium]